MANALLQDNVTAQEQALKDPTVDKRAAAPLFVLMEAAVLPARAIVLEHLTLVPNVTSPNAIPRAL
jgi:hypothetical protein